MIGYAGRMAIIAAVLPILSTAPLRAADAPSATSAEHGAKPAALDYNRDIRPILSNNCFKCHGPDAAERQAGVRLDVRDAALRPGDTGDTPIVPGKPDASALVARIFAQDESERMPPADSGTHSIRPG